MTEPIWSTGGAGGESAVTEDLEWAVGVLRAAADHVGDAQREVARRRATLLLDPGVGHAVAIAELGYATRLAPAVEAELEDVARRLAAVAQAYLDAESAARHGVSALGMVREALEDGRGANAWATRVGAAALLAGTPIGGLLALTGHGEVIGEVLPDGAPPTTGTLTRDAVESVLNVPAYTVLVAAIAALVAMPLLQLLTAWRGGITGTEVSVAPAESLEDVMRRLRDTELAQNGGVRIERWTGEDGVTRRVVFIPGTEDWLNVSTNPFDSNADLALMMDKLPDAALFVSAALAEDGAGPGDPVMLAGHSLGGIVAAALAANPEFRSRFAVQAVVTAGSPTGRIALPATVNAMHFEGTRDIVPGLDGKPNPDSPTRVTVHHDARDSELAALSGEGEDIGSAHHLDTYAQSARLVDHGVSDSTEAWLNAEREFLTPGAGAVVTEYRP